MQLREPFYDLEGQIAIDLPGARALFTTRSWGDVRDTATRIGERLGVSPVRPRQVHGNAILDLMTEPPASSIALGTEADAIMTARPGVAAMVMTADCLPIALIGGGAVVAVHAGWRGLGSGMIGSALMRLQQVAPGAPVTAAIGPGAGACCYEVGSELHERFPGFSRGRNLDLKAIARAQLELGGVAVVHDCELCTICATDPELFSYRRDGETAGRQALLAWLS